MIAVVRLSAAGRPVVPWKNGGGTTQQVAAYPHDADFSTMAWRISIATVDRGGPFSRFEGVDRSLSVLSGRLDLVLGDDRRTILSDADGPVRFEGELDVIGTPLSGPVTDLNVMTRRGAWAAQVEPLAPGSSTRLHPQASTVAVVAAGQTVVAVDGEPHALTALDAVLITDADGARIDIDAIARSYVVTLRRTAG
jgi:environmental stress-induced protein Ves